MGLAVVHGIAKSHNGAVTVYSEPGKGATFQIFFPRIVNGSAPETEDIAPPPQGNERILLVDDEKLLADIGKQMLKNLGYEVLAITSSIEALNAFKTQPDNFDLVITDMTMPNMTGVDLAKRIMRIRPDIPIVLCTGFSDMVWEEKAKAIGIREFVMKPIIRQTMARVIRRVLDQEKESNSQ
jgi:CheY-like chemotaxis protein